MNEAISSANADKALEAMGRMFDEVGIGDLTDYHRGRFEQLAIGFLGSGGEPEMLQEWLEKADSRFGLTRGRVEMVKQIAKKATREKLSQDDQVGLARSLIVLRLFPEKLRQVAGDLMRDSPGTWQDVATAVSLSLTNPKAGEGFSQGDNQVFARAAERTGEFFEVVVNEAGGQTVGSEAGGGGEGMKEEEKEVVPTQAELVKRWNGIRSLEAATDLDGQQLEQLARDVVVVFAARGMKWSAPEIQVMVFLEQRFDLVKKGLGRLEDMMRAGDKDMLRLYWSFVFALPRKSLTEQQQGVLRRAYRVIEKREGGV